MSETKDRFLKDPRLDDPTLFRSDVNQTQLSRFDYARVSASPQNLHIQFAILGTVNLLVTLFTGILIAAILRSKKLRKQPFDLYVVFMAIPDFISGFSCMLTCLVSVRGSEYVGEAMCGYQSFYLNFSVSANTWMAAVITYQIHKLLRYSRVRRRYIPPTTKEVGCHAACVYAWAIFWGGLSASQSDIFGMTFQSHAYGGFYCAPMEAEGNSWFFYLVFLHIMFFFPANYAVAALVHIFWKGLMPKSGQRQQIALLLIRIMVLYFAIFMPTGIAQLVGSFVYFKSDWIFYIPAVLYHFHGILQTMLCYSTNPAIRQSIQKILMCNWSGDGNAQEPWALSAYFSSLFLHGESQQTRLKDVPHNEMATLRHSSDVVDQSVQECLRMADINDTLEQGASMDEEIKEEVVIADCDDEDYQSEESDEHVEPVYQDGGTSRQASVDVVDEQQQPLPQQQSEEEEMVIVFVNGAEDSDIGVFDGGDDSDRGSTDHNNEHI
mmetsp:Transcript_2779/g.7105  ORF Transcript_2779/g.7105 Transcript_2779/m.7105 type:complete len:493 (+) Transcript_2779:73-1551(+)